MDALKTGDHSEIPRSSKMAAGELSITPANIAYDPLAPASIDLNNRVILGETVTELMVAYLDQNVSKYKKATNATSTESKVAGLVYDAGDLDDHSALIEIGQLNIGATLVAGTTYYLSDTAGKLVPLSGLGSGDFVVRIGYAKSNINT